MRASPSGRYTRERVLFVRAAISHSEAVKIFDGLMVELAGTRRAVKDFDRLLAKHHIGHPTHEGCEPGLALEASGV